MHLKYTPLEKQSKKAQRQHAIQQRGNWNGVIPVTRFIPNRKKQESGRTKQRMHAAMHVWDD